MCYFPAVRAYVSCFLFVIKQYFPLLPNKTKGSETFFVTLSLHFRLFLRIYNWLGQYAPKDFLQKHDIHESAKESTVAKPKFPLLPLSVGFCISLFRNLKSLEKAFSKMTL